MMNSRRLMGFALKPNTTPYRIVEHELRFASQQNKPAHVWLGSFASLDCFNYVRFTTDSDRCAALSKTT
jgi:hypothetical protein